jgi:hypothetical protein
MRLLSILKAISVAIGNVVARVILTVMYFTLLPLFAVWTRLRVDPLRLKPKETAWLPRADSPEDLDSARRQY